MQRKSTLFCLLVLLTLAPLGLAAESEPPADRYLKLEDVEPGMVGVARTVFVGDHIEEFPVEIIDVIHKTGPGQNLILARLGGDKLKHTGIITGMSGTPIYVDGKLIGALAYAWPYSTEPITGITPIEEMLQILEKPGQTKSPGRLPGAGTPVRLPGALRNLLPFGAGPPLLPKRPGLQPLRTPVAFSGLSGAAVEMLSAHLAPYGLVATPVGGAAELKAAGAALQPGSPFCIQMVTGDIEVAALGTITDRQGKKLLAMGHQFLGEGQVTAPISGAYVHAVVPSRYISFRIGSPGPTVGSLVSDQTSGVLAELGAKTDTIAVDLTVEQDERKCTYHYRVFRHPVLSASFIAETISSSLQVWQNFPRRLTVELDAELEVQGFEPIKLEDTFSGPSTFADIVLGLSGPVGMLTDNRFAQVKVEKVSVDARLIPGESTALIESVELDRRRLRPGDEILAQVRFAPYQAPRETLLYKMKVPEQTPAGPKLLIFSDAQNDLQLDMRSAPYRFRPKNIDELVNILRQHRCNTDLAVRLTAMGYGLAVEGKELRELPPSMLSVLGSGRTAATTPLVSFTRQTHTTPWVLSGRVVLPIVVLPPREVGTNTG